MMMPFVLRRKKHQVLKHLPAKTRRVEYCDLSPAQNELYEKEVAKGRRVIAARAAGEKTGNETSNIMMALRKASIHPLLFRHLYNDEKLANMSKAIIKEEQYREANVDMIYEDMEVMTDWELNRLWYVCYQSSLPCYHRKRAPGHRQTAGNADSKNS
jgi:SWI/SNF-related matrix-associated actin-dependent regulator 1 of chromatin subfamily A